MRQNPDLRIKIDGHTDSQGTESHNNTLSLSRSQAVADYLLRHGISEDRVKYRGFGSKIPIASNRDNKGRQFNRRVEFVIVEK